MTLPAGCVERCPGCRFRTTPYEESIRAKESFVRERLGGFGGVIDAIRAEPARAWGYRSSAFLRTERRAGAWVAGVTLRRGRETELLPIPECPLHAPELNLRLGRALRLLDSCADVPLFGLWVRGGLLTLVIKAREEGWSARLREVDWGAIGFAGVFANYHPSAGDRVLSSKGWVHLWGAREGVVVRGDLSFAHGPASFSQQLPELHSDSIRRAAEFFAEDVPDGVVDLYSGVGITLREWRARGWPAIGVEMGRDAVQAARAHGEVLEGAARERVPQLAQFVAERSRVAVYANPSRLGLEERVADWIADEKRLRKMAYLSCSPGTLRRDLERLGGAGWRVERAIPYDFLPQTIHVEVLVLLRRL